MWAQNKGSCQIRVQGFFRHCLVRSLWLQIPLPKKGSIKPPTPLKGLRPCSQAHLWVELLLRAGVAVLAGVSILALAGVSPLIPMFYVRTWRRPGPVSGWGQMDTGERLGSGGHQLDSCSGPLSDLPALHSQAQK